MVLSKVWRVVVLSKREEMWRQGELRERHRIAEETGNPRRMSSE
jgi:hypothetical protein